MIRHALLDNAKTLSLQGFYKHCKVQPGYMTFGYSSDSSTISKRLVGRSGEVYQLEFFKTRHEVTMRSSLNEKVANC